MSKAPDIMRGHTLGRVDDADGFAVYVGTYNGTVTIWDKFPYRLDPHQAEEFARLFVRACWEAAGQDGTP
jgi:hypothetical protein